METLQEAWREKVSVREWGGNSAKDVVSKNQTN